MTSISKVYWNLYYLKKYHLMAEYHNIKPIEIFRECKNLIELDEIIEENLKDIQAQLGDKAFPLEEDYETYTYETHHRKFFNEIECPLIVEKLFKELQKVTDTEFKENSTSYCVTSYDLEPSSFWFKTEEEAEDFLEENDVAPYTLFYYENSLYTEIYSA